MNHRFKDRIGKIYVPYCNQILQIQGYFSGSKLYEKFEFHLGLEKKLLKSILRRYKDLWLTYLQSMDYIILRKNLNI